MNRNEGVPLVKFMMLLSSMAPLFILVGLRGIDIKIITEKHLWITIALLVITPYLFLFLRILAARKNSDIISVDISSNTNNKDYLFTYLFTVLLPLYSYTISNTRDAVALAFALIIVMFVLWNMNLHFINIYFALKGYKVYTLDSVEGAILLSSRHILPTHINSLTVHRLSNSVFIEIKNHQYAN